MKARIYLIIILFCMALNSLKADTIDYWKVYLNKKIIKEYNIHSENLEIVFSKAKLRAIDTIEVAYFDDTPCPDCNTKLFVVDKNKKTITTIYGKGTSSRLPIKLTNFQVWTMKHQSEYFDLYYSEDDNRRKTLVARIKISH